MPRRMAGRYMEEVFDMKNSVPKSDFTASLLETYPNLEDTARDPKTGSPIPNEAHVADAKRWVEENEL